MPPVPGHKEYVTWTQLRLEEGDGVREGVHHHSPTSYWVAVANAAEVGTSEVTSIELKTLDSSKGTRVGPSLRDSCGKAGVK